MPKWKKDETEFTVSVTYHKHRGYQSYIPKPIIEKLGNPESLKFRVNEDNEVVLVSGNPSIDTKVKYANKN
jgi:hypothetical protein